MAERGRGPLAPERTGEALRAQAPETQRQPTRRRPRPANLLVSIRQTLATFVHKPEMIEGAPKNLFEQIAYLQQFGLATLETEGYGLLAVGVGGSYNRNLGPNTAIESYNPETRTIKMTGMEEIAPIRSEESGKHKTRVDFDGIFVPVVRDGEALRIMTTAELSAKMSRGEYEARCKALQTRLKRETRKINGPSISIDPIFYHIPYKNTAERLRAELSHRSKVLNLFLSTIDIYSQQNGQDRIAFSLSPLQQEVTAESLAPFAIESQNGTRAYFFSPTAELMRYLVRGLGKKDKDKKKTSEGSPLHAVSQEFLRIVSETAPDYYQSNFGPWENFGIQMQNNLHLTIALRRPVYKLFWGTVGEFMAHNRVTLKLKDILT